MGLELKAEEKSILALFTGDKNQYVIPPYQRPYSWDEKQCKQLFEDLKKSFEDERTDSYFLGNIVIASSKENQNRLEVIDGQQRLITLTLFLKALYFFDDQNRRLKSSIWELDARTEEAKEARLETMVFQEKDSKFLKEALELTLSDCKQTKEDNQFKKNICYFYTELKGFNKKLLFNFVDFLLSNVSLLPIEIQGSSREVSRQNAIKIFETINNRGLSLSTSDLFKAKLFSLSLHENKSDSFLKKWNYLYDECEKLDYSIDKIFITYMNIIKFKEEIEESNSLRDFFLDKEYSPLNSQSIKYNEIMESLLKIIHSLKFFREVRISPSVYADLTKWFQIMDEFKGEAFNLQLLYEVNLENYEETIVIYKRFIKYIIYSNEKSIQKNIFYNLITNGKIEKIENKIDFQFPKKLALLSFYLNPKQKAIYPYCIINFSEDEEKDYFKYYLFQRDFTIFHRSTTYLFLINDFDISSGIFGLECNDLLNKLQKSKIEYNFKLYKLYEKKSFDELKKFITENAKIEKNRLENFISSLDEN